MLFGRLEAAARHRGRAAGSIEYESFCFSFFSLILRSEISSFMRSDCNSLSDFNLDVLLKSQI